MLVLGRYVPRNVCMYAQSYQSEDFYATFVRILTER